MIVCALELGQEIAKRLFEFILCIGSNHERFIHGLAEPLDRIGGSGAEHLCVGFHCEKLRQREILFLKTQPADRLPQMAILDFIFSVAGQFDRCRPALFDPKFREEYLPSRLEHPPQLCDESKWSEIEDDVVRQFVADRETHAPYPIEGFLMLSGFTTA